MNIFAYEEDVNLGETEAECHRQKDNFVSFQTLYVEILTLSVMVFRLGPLGKD